jgi:hypothetical protein
MPAPSIMAAARDSVAQSFLNFFITRLLLSLTQ